MTCLNCSTDKPDTEFYPDGQYPLWSHYCRECRGKTIREIEIQSRKQIALMTDLDRKSFFTVINDDTAHLRKKNFPDWIIIDQPGFTPPTSA